MSNKPERGFLMPQRYPLEVNDYQRQKPIVIDLEDLTGNSGMPDGFHLKAGARVTAYTKYWVRNAYE